MRNKVYVGVFLSLKKNRLTFVQAPFYTTEQLMVYTIDFDRPHRLEA